MLITCFSFFPFFFLTRIGQHLNLLVFRQCLTLSQKRLYSCYLSSLVYLQHRHGEVARHGIQQHPSPVLWQGGWQHQGLGQGQWSHWTGSVVTLSSGCQISMFSSLISSFPSNFLSYPYVPFLIKSPIVSFYCLQPRILICVPCDIQRLCFKIF